MPDNPNRRRPQDSSKININQPYEVQYWTEELGISETKLKRAVEAVGPMVVDVKKWLRDNN